MGRVFVLLCVICCVGFVNCQFGFYQPREERRHGSPFGFNFLQDSRRVTDRYMGFFHRGDRNQGNYQGNRRPIIQQDPYYGYNSNGQVTFPTNPSQMNFGNNYNENYQPSGEVNYETNIPSNIPNEPPTGIYFPDSPSGGDSIPNIPPTGAVDFSNEQPSEAGIPNEPPTGPGFSNVPPTGSGFSNQPPTGSGFSNQPPTGSGFSNVPPTGSGFSNQPPTGSGFSNVPPSGAGFPNFPPSGGDGLSGNNGIPNSPPVSFNEGSTEVPELTPVPVNFESRNNFNFGPSGLFQEACTTVDQGVGSCISVFQCQPYVKIISEARTNPNVVALLRKAHCGFEGTTAKVCCPRPGIPTAPPTTTTTTTTTTAAPQPTSPVQLDSSDFVADLPEPPVCGTSNATLSRVVNGVKAKLGDFPWMALLGYKNRRGPGARWLCGGSIITSKHILTAAHCINGHEDDLFIVRVGELNLEREDDGATPIDIPIKAKIKHEGYSGTAFTNDIGILVLQNEITFTNLIKPICVPRSSELRASTFVDHNPIIAGWGDTEFRGAQAQHLMAVQLPVVTNDFCKSAYASYTKQTIDDRVLCAGYKKGGMDACQGDSGGPLMQPVYNQLIYKTYFYQIGVVSFGKKCAEPGFPGVYSRVTHFVPWIESKVIGS